MLPSSRLLDDGQPSVQSETNGARDQGPVPSIVVQDTDNGNPEDDDPPPYTAIAPPNHVGWPFDFSGIPYSACTTTPCRGSLAGFQALAPSSASAFRPEGADGQHTSISMPLMPYRLFKFGSHRSLFSHRVLPFTDNVSVSKDTAGRTRRYGAILVAAAVIVFLMALSLLVRFVMEKSLWRR